MLVPQRFNTEVDEDGALYMYAEGDNSFPPAAKMPAGGFYFDSLKRQPPFEEENLRLEDNLEEFGPISDEDLKHLNTESLHIFEQTDRAIMLVFPGAGFGDIALVPGPMLKNPKGIRDIEEWYISTVSRQDFIYQIFNRQCDIAMQNLPKVYEAVGNRITAVWLSGTDFGAQHGSFISPKSFQKLYKPHYKRINDWIHANTKWKVFIHCCGSIMSLIPEFIESGFDILNPVQTSAKNMDPHELKARFGSRLTFWGGGVDTQQVLPFGTPEDVRAQVRERLCVFGTGGGFVFNPIHNVQAGVQSENLLAMYETVRDYGKYPLS